jgi:hypothetical protein
VVQQEDTPLRSKLANLLLQPAYLKAATAQKALKGAAFKPHLQQPNPQRTVLQTSISNPVMATPSSPSPLSAEARETDLQITGATSPPSFPSPADLQKRSLTCAIRSTPIWGTLPLTNAPFKNTDWKQNWAG